jgi:hypothetical protein
MKGGHVRWGIDRVGDQPLVPVDTFGDKAPF